MNIERLYDLVIPALVTRTVFIKRRKQPYGNKYGDYRYLAIRTIAMGDVYLIYDSIYNQTYRIGRYES